FLSRCTKDSPSFKDDLDVVKFLCKDLWINLFRKQIDNLRTNHQGTYVLQDNKFSLLSQFSNSKQYMEEAPKYLVYTCGMVRGALSNLGIDSIVTAEVSVMPAWRQNLKVHVFSSAADSTGQASSKLRWKTCRTGFCPPEVVREHFSLHASSLPWTGGSTLSLRGEGEVQSPCLKPILDQRDQHSL
ncbi:TPC6B protein, partial [Polyodon spathula]|nr:TPC6B protein [Polyodon spathula]